MQKGIMMEKYLVKEFASEIIAQTRGRISRIDAEALAIVYIAKMKMIYPIYISYAYRKGVNIWRI